MAENQETGSKCIKYMIFITNFIFLMIGFLLISIGSTITTVYSDFELFMEKHHFEPANLLIAIGVIIFFVSLFGCCAAIKRSVALINVYVFLLILLLILEISAVIAAFSMRSKIYNNVETNMLGALGDYSRDVYTRDSWDFLQQRMSCCGVHQLYDWWKKNVSDVDGIKLQVGLSTFNVPRSCRDYFSTEIVLYEKGCLDRLYHIINDGAVMIGIGGICVAVVQLLLAVFAYMLGNIVRHTKTSEEMQRQEARQRAFEQLAFQGLEKPPVKPLNCDTTASEA